MIKIKYKYNNKINYIYAKLEYYNLTGSIKDRMVYYIIEKAYKENKLKTKQALIEATSGNTGISIAAIGSYFRNPVYIFMPDWVSVERKKIMEMYGANVILVSRADGGFKKCIELADELAIKLDGFRINQFSNKNNIDAHYLTTGKEIVNSIDNIGGIVSGIGTGGTLMGISKLLRETNSNLVVCAIEPDEAPIITKGTVIGNHKIDGIGDDFIPDLVDTRKIDIVYTINDEDAINMTRLLATKLGLGVGISSGANFLGSVLLNENINSNVVTIFSDDNKKYLSTDLSKNVDLSSNFISNKIELISYEVI